ncbi:hypothetical protein OIU84_014633 [Salix udensis]|uniref:COBRA C-terminal domain-containing protein n=1 Tax=Salix udensis TaxID=889485 RepID=A0AAD6JEG0_9ROSI|nr:hypothetical protein OIU84_014633 [Salix udensis]
MRFLIFIVLFFVIFSCSGAYDPLDPTGNVTVKWDIMSWTADGYIAIVTLFNFQTFRHFMKPGWTIGWTWAKKEIIWSINGAQAVEQGDCSKFKANIPHSCKRSPAVVDLLPGAPFNQQFGNCCKVKLPKSFTLLGPGPGYTCGPPKMVPSTKFLTPDGLRRTQALLTWNVTCTYSQFMARKNPSCCVSLSSFYNQILTPCPTCACGCQNNGTCVNGDSRILQLPVGKHDPERQQLTSSMHAPYVPGSSSLACEDDTAMFYGMKNYNDELMEAGPLGNLQSEVLLQKDQNTFTFKQGWAFPRKVYFNGDECMLPPPDTYPFLPNSAHGSSHFFSMLISTLIFLLTYIW